MAVKLLFRVLVMALPIAEPAAAQFAAAPLAAPSAVERELDWDRTFPLGRDFGEWSEAGQLEEDGDVTGNFFLHSRSLRRVGPENLPFPGNFVGPFIQADIIFFKNGANGEEAGYLRYLAVLDCDGYRAFGILAQGKIVIGPDRIVRPQGAVRETFGYNQVESARNRTVFDAICFDTAVQGRFGL